jgi:acyl-CoA thioester hydrolase
MLPNAAIACEYELDVVADDIDEMGHVNNAAYLTWVQAAVLYHWRRFAPREAVTAHLWVALKHEIKYMHPAFLDDHVVVKVALQRLLGPRAFYKTWIHHGEDLLAEVESCWCCLNSMTRKPVRLASDIAAHFLPTQAPNTAVGQVSRRR